MTKKKSLSKLRRRSASLAIFYGLATGSMIATAIWRTGCRAFVEHSLVFASFRYLYSIGTCLAISLPVMLIVVGGWFLVYCIDCLTVYRLKQFPPYQLQRLQKLARRTFYLTMIVWLVVLICFMPAAHSAQVFQQNLMIAVSAIIALFYTGAHYIVEEAIK